MSKLSDRMAILDNETDVVYAWRYEQMLRAGMDDDTASVVAASKMDIHDARRYLESGCAPETLAALCW